MRIREGGQDGCKSPRPCSVTAKSRGKPLQLLLFALNFLKHPKSVAGLLPSSRFLVDGVLKQIDWSQARVIVEYGAGVGVFTHRVLDRMRTDATLIALEINPRVYSVPQQLSGRPAPAPSAGFSR